MSGGSGEESGPLRGSGGVVPAPAPAPVDVGIVAAMGIEVGFLTDRLSRVRKYSGPRHAVIEGELGGKLVALIVSGMGRESAARGTELLLAGHRPRGVISVGFAGALDPSLPRYAAVVPSEVGDLSGRSYPIPLPFSIESLGPRARAGRLLTVDAIVRTAAEKADLRARYQADVIDMETSAVAALCVERSMPFFAIRVVSDEAGIDLPPEIATLMTKSGSYRVGAALRAIWERPSRLKEFWALHEQAQEAADHLAEVTARAIARLGP